eukprot:m.194550 g.194550  ORF g.194550 m.194550 type:complete len:70 (-) comp53707_c0_seq14:1476-1685(-)
MPGPSNPILPPAAVSAHDCSSRQPRDAVPQTSNTTEIHSQASYGSRASDDFVVGRSFNPSKMAPRRHSD